MDPGTRAAFDALRAHLDRKLDTVDQRIDAVDRKADQRVDALDQKVDALRDELRREVRESAQQEKPRTTTWWSEALIGEFRAYGGGRHGATRRIDALDSEHAQTRTRVDRSRSVCWRWSALAGPQAPEMTGAQAFTRGPGCTGRARSRVELGAGDEVSIGMRKMPPPTLTPGP